MFINDFESKFKIIDLLAIKLKIRQYYTQSQY